MQTVYEPACTVTIVRIQGWMKHSNWFWPMVSDSPSALSDTVAPAGTKVENKLTPGATTAGVVFPDSVFSSGTRPPPKADTLVNV